MAFERITVDPARMGGLPTIRGTRVTVGMILGQLAGSRPAGVNDLSASPSTVQRVRSR
ncbi:MAG: DUF433 domain-containing protein [Acidimicrobiales bacterium]